MEIKIKKLHPEAAVPLKATPLSIGYDLYVPHDTCIEHTRQVIPLGFAIELPDGIEAKIEPRSGFSSKGIEGFALNSHDPIIPFSALNDVLGGCSQEEPLWQRIDKAERFNADVLVGKIDPDFRGEVGVIIRNNNPLKPFLVKAGTRIAQMTFYRTEDVGFVLAQELSETDRGAGGYGSTGI